MVIEGKTTSELVDYILEPDINGIANMNMKKKGLTVSINIINLE